MALKLLKSCLTVEWLRASRDWQAWLQPFLFFVMALLLFPLALGADKKFLQHIAPGLLCVVALLAMLLAADSVWREDKASGCLDQYCLHPNVLLCTVWVKTLMLWFRASVPILVLLPVWAVSFALPSSMWSVLWLCLALLTLYLAFVCMLASALTVSLQNGGLLLALVLLPLCMPALIFAAGAMVYAGEGISARAMLSLLAAQTSLAVAAVPFLSQYVLRLGVSA